MHAWSARRKGRHPCPPPLPPLPHPLLHCIAPSLRVETRLMKVKARLRDPAPKQRVFHTIYSSLKACLYIWRWLCGRRGLYFPSFLSSHPLGPFCAHVNCGTVNHFSSDRNILCHPCDQSESLKNTLIFSSCSLEVPSGLVC